MAGLRVVAALLCGRPRMIFTAACLSVLSCAISDPLGPETPTALSGPGNKLQAHNVSLRAALASTAPHAIFCVRLVWGAAEDCEASKDTASQIHDARFRRSLSLKAAARLGAEALELASANNGHIPAITLAHPPYRTVTGEPDYYQASKALPAEGLLVSHA